MTLKTQLRRGIGVALSLTLAFGFTLTQVSSANAAANRTSQKVTICHRTHATTNPYRQITVSVNSVIKNNGHDDDDHNPSYPGKPVFDPSFNYPSNQKQWQDIIPAFYYSVTLGANTTTEYFAGRNWTTDGMAIYYGLGSKAGLCGSSGAKEFALDEYNSWLEDNPSSNTGQRQSQRRSIINDLKDQGAEEDGNLGGFNDDFEALPSNPKKPKGPNRPKEFEDLIAKLITENTGKPAEQINQALAGVVWKDLNRNGIQDEGEEVFGNLGIQIRDNGVLLTPEQLAALRITPASFSSSYQSPTLFTFARWSGNQATFATAVSTPTLLTDANGYFEVPSLPPGEWEVSVLTPDGWSYTFDSAGSSDGEMPGTFVPPGGAGFAWAGLVFSGSATDTTAGTTSPGTSGTTSPGTSGNVLSATGQDVPWMLAVGASIFLLVFGAVFVQIRRKYS